MLSSIAWATLSACLAVGISLDEKDYSASDIIRRDVAIIGGGSSGTYTAVRLKDHGKSVLLIEKEPLLGGHAQTYTAPNGFTLDYGASAFYPVKIVRDYFERFNIPVVPMPANYYNAQYFDYATGKSVNYTAPSDSERIDALKAYKAQIDKYPLLQQGFNLTYPVAEDLLLTFGDFVRKYNLGGIVNTAFFYNQGFTPLLDVPALYMIKYFGDGEIETRLTGPITTKSHNIYTLYAAAGSFLGETNVLTSSHVISMDRCGSRVKILVHSPGGKKLIIAKKLVSSIPPTLGNLAAYDLSAHERNLFGQWKWNGYYVGLLNSTGLDLTKSYNAADPAEPFYLPRKPGVYNFFGSPPSGVSLVYYASPNEISETQVKADIETSLARLQKFIGIKRGKPEWLVFSSHSPFNLEVSEDKIKDRFYKDLYALNGQRNTFYTGAAFHTAVSTALWEYSENCIVPLVLSSLN